MIPCEGVRRGGGGGCGTATAMVRVWGSVLLCSRCRRSGMAGCEAHSVYDV